MRKKRNTTENWEKNHQSGKGKSNWKKKSKILPISTFKNQTRVGKHYKCSKRTVRADWTGLTQELFIKKTIVNQNTYLWSGICLQIKTVLNQFSLVTNSNPSHLKDTSGKDDFPFFGSSWFSFLKSNNNHIWRLS